MSVQVNVIKLTGHRRNKSTYESSEIRIVCISDTHNLHELIELPPGDILIHCGDFCNKGNLFGVRKFVKYFCSLPQYKHKLVIPGNHETLPDLISKFFPKNSNCHFLLNSSITLEGITFYGARFKPAWILFFGSDKMAQEYWGHIPEDVDILITHQPPIGYGDVGSGPRSRGNTTLRNRVDIIKPTLHLFGHVHEGHGVHRLGNHENRETTFIGCASKIEGKNVRPPIVIDYFLRGDPC